MTSQAVSRRKQYILEKLRPQLELFAKSYGRNRPLIQRSLFAGFVLYAITSTVSGFSGSKAKRKNPPTNAEREQEELNKKRGIKTARKSQALIDNIFFARLKRLLRIVIPSWHSKEAGMLGLHTAFLLLRTLLSLYVADLDGKIVSSLVRAQLPQFLFNLSKWMAVAVPACYCNAMLEFLRSKIGSAYRTRLTTEVLGTYLDDSNAVIDGKEGEGQVFYQMANLDDRIKNADQMITVDIQRFSNQLAEIYPNIANPVLDLLLYNYQLSRNVGAEAMVVLTIFGQASAGLLKALTPPFGTFAAAEATLEGELRFTHSRLIESAEEVAFYRGEDYEKNVIERGYFALVKHINRIIRIRVWHGMLEEGIVKWLWGSFGLCLCAIPVFAKLPGLPNLSDMGSRTEGFVTNRRLLLSASDAMGRMMYSYKELAELAGYTARVATLLDTMDDVKVGKFQKNLVSTAGTDGNAEVLKGRGSIIESEDITFKEVPIVSPNGDVMIKSLSFSVKRGESLVVLGPNGSGKSSLFRILGGLWPVYGGVVFKPPAREFIYVPQRPYFCTGTLRDQIIYPDNHADMQAAKVTDDDLMHILGLLDMTHIVEREGGWDAKREWRDALSGGDKQRVAMARLFYHKPTYAILDESTAAVTPEVEKTMYEQAAALGITLLTVSHRPSLLQYHKHILEFDGQGGYVFTKLDDPNKRLALQEEQRALEQKLADVPKLKEKLEHLLTIKEERERAQAGR